MLERFLIVWLCLLSLVAYRWPHWTWGLSDPFLASRGSLPYCIAVIMFALGWMLPRDEVRQVARRWPVVLGGTALQYISMPLLAYGFGRMFALDDDMMVGIAIVGCVPGAMASNVLTYLARGNTSYSVSLTTLATLLSPLIVPVALKLALRGAGSVSLDMGQVSTNLLLTVVAPVVTGHLLARRFPSWERPAQRVGSIVANLTILWVIAVVVAVNRESFSLEGALVWALAGINAAGYLAGYAGGILMRLPEPMRRALTLEVGMQNAGLGASLAATLFADRPAVAIPSALYMFGCMVTGTILAQSWHAFWRPDAAGPSDDVPAEL